MTKKIIWTSITAGIVIGILLSVATVVLAGSLDPVEGPSGSGSQMHTLQQIYNRINNRATAAKMTSFTEPSSGPTSGTMHTLDEIYDLLGLRAPVARTGQVTSYATSDDGDLEKGVAWPNPRFTNNGNGTVTDNLTGLIWLRNAGCPLFFSGDTFSNWRTWSSAITAANSLGEGYCGLSDGSSPGDWRLPSLRELESLRDYEYVTPALSNSAGTSHFTEGDPFTFVNYNFYWTSTARGDPNDWKYIVNFYDGRISDADTIPDAGDPPQNYVWPVFGGE
jgi:hypothetical protein